MNNNNPLNDDNNIYSGPTNGQVAAAIIILVVVLLTCRLKAQISVPFPEYGTSAKVPQSRLKWNPLTPYVAATLRKGNYALGRFREGTYTHTVNAIEVIPYKQTDCVGGYHGLYKATNAMGETICDITHYIDLEGLTWLEQLEVLYGNGAAPVTLAPSICIE